MKTSLRLRLFAAAVLFAFACTSQAVDRAPALSIEAALKIAQDYLKEKPAPPAIVALTLESATLRGQKVWFARWSSPIFGGPKPEIGLQIDMSGEMTKVVSGGGEPGKGQRRYGARDMR